MPIPTKADLEVLVEQLRRQLDDALQQAELAEATQRESTERRRAGEAGGLATSAEDWERLRREYDEARENQGRLEVQRREAERRAEAAEQSAAELDRQFSEARDRTAALERRARSVTLPTEVNAELGRLEQQLTGTQEELLTERERARVAEEGAADA